jgi:hypothetical protein
MEHVINPFKSTIWMIMLVVGVSLFGLYLFTVDIHIKEDAFTLGMDIATVIIPWVVLAQGAFYRDVKHWSIVVIRDNTITSYYRKKETCKVDLKKTTYYARLKIPKDRLSASNVYIISNKQFTVPEDKPYRSFYDNSIQVMVVLTMKCSYEFPQKDWICVQKPGADDWL